MGNYMSMYLKIRCQIRQFTKGGPLPLPRGGHLPPAGGRCPPQRENHVSYYIFTVIIYFNLNAMEVHCI